VQLRDTAETARAAARSEFEGKIAGLENKIKERENAAARLMLTLKEQEVTIKSEFEGKIAGLEGKIKERENSIARLMLALKEQEITIRKLTESSESWKRKYQFLATDQPDDPPSAAGK